jgi:hypothetical protein
VFFVVDRKDLDYQTMKEYQHFSLDSVNGSDSTAGLKRNLGKDDNKIIVTTIQKLNNLMKAEGELPIYHKQVVFIVHHKVKTTGFSRSALAARICHTGGVAWIIHMEVIRSTRLSIILYG